MMPISVQADDLVYGIGSTSSVSGSTSIVSGSPYSSIYSSAANCSTYEFRKIPKSNYLYETCPITFIGDDEKSNHYYYNLFYSDSHWTSGSGTTTATTGLSGHWIIDKNEWITTGPIAVPSPGDRLREVIRARQAPAFLQHRRPLRAPLSPAEERARETLRQLVGDANYRSLLRNGFITVRAKSGKVYQIHPGHDMTCVFQGGKMIERLCVILSGNFPPSDAVIVRYLMILNDEDTFRSKAIQHTTFNHRTSPTALDNRPLLEIFQELKQAG